MIVGGNGAKYPLERQAGVTYEILGQAAGYTDGSVPVTFSGKTVEKVDLVLVRDESAAPQAKVRRPSRGTRSSSGRKPSRTS